MNFNRTRLNDAVAFARLNPQTKRIAQHLLDVGNISSVEAQAIFKARSLTRRIRDLREQEVQITSVRKTDSTGQRYVRYVLA